MGPRRRRNGLKPLFDFCGGRKMFIAFLGCVLLTWGAFQVDTYPFAQWGQWIVTLLIGTKIASAYEDGVKHRASPGHWQQPGSQPTEPQIPKNSATGGEET